MQRKKPAHKSPPKPSGSRALSPLSPPNRSTLLYLGAGPATPDAGPLVSESLWPRTLQSPATVDLCFPSSLNAQVLLRLREQVSSFPKLAELPSSLGSRAPVHFAPLQAQSPLPPVPRFITPKAFRVPSHLKLAVMEPGLTSRIGPGGDPGVHPSALFVLFPPRSTLRPPETKEQPQEATPFTTAQLLALERRSGQTYQDCSGGSRTGSPAGRERAVRPWTSAWARTLWARSRGLGALWPSPRPLCLQGLKRPGAHWSQGRSIHLS